MRNIASTSSVFALIFCFLPIDNAVALSGRFKVERSEFVLRLDDGRVLRRRELVGLTLRLSGRDSGAEIRITDIGEENAAVGGPVTLYRLAAVNSADQPPADLCEPDIHGRRAGFPLSNASGGFDFVCTSGAAGKCVLMGYRPWDATDEMPLASLHRACVHMLRADYGGDDRPTTRNGTAVDIYDRFGIQLPAMRPNMNFEAAWSEDGAVCVAHPRIRAKHHARRAGGTPRPSGGPSRSARLHRGGDAGGAEGHSLQPIGRLRLSLDRRSHVR